MTHGQRPDRRPIRHRVRRAVRRLLSRRRAPAVPDGPSTTLPPIIVGGTGRSGTTVTGRLLGAHPDYWMIPFEVRFLSDANGLVDLVAGRTTMATFRRRMLGPWFVRRDGVGLGMITTRRALRAQLRRLESELDGDRRRAAERFVHRLFDPPAIAAGARGWVEMTPTTAKAAGALLRLLPDARFIHSLRDGRDAAASVVRLHWGPSDVVEAVDWWADSLEAGFAAIAAAPADRVLTVRMETLLRDDREGGLARLLAFAGLDEAPALRAFFDGEATADRAHIGRWRTDVPADRLAAFEARYAARAASLRERWGYPEPDPEPGRVLVPAAS